MKKRKDAVSTQLRPAERSRVVETNFAAIEAHPPQGPTEVLERVEQVCCLVLRLNGLLDMLDADLCQLQYQYINQGVGLPREIPPGVAEVLNLLRREVPIAIRAHEKLITETTVFVQALPLSIASDPVGWVTQFNLSFTAMIEEVKLLPLLLPMSWPFNLNAMSDRIPALSQSIGRSIAAMGQYTKVLRAIPSLDTAVNDKGGEEMSPWNKTSRFSTFWRAESHWLKRTPSTHQAWE